ncbi:adenylosuccinate synthetase [Candidatus Parcubacteria bacterium]|nr:MAG: adenylosuccinate synthetase [Candidatus Parcubacteria bacterium]
MSLRTDVVVDLQYGDCGKGKITHHLAHTQKYSHVLRYNGGCNAGHTIFHQGKKFVTHQIPAGVFFGIKSIIGSGCVVSPEQFFKELQMLEEGGIDTKGKIFIAKNAHVITEQNKEEDTKVGGAIGTTGQGNGPAYRDKYGRTGVRAEKVPELAPYLIDLYDEWYGDADVQILAEGAQGFGLDIDWGDYPFVTSSHCTTAGALLNGLPPNAVKDVWGVAKIYETYVGSKKFQPEGAIFDKIGDIGEEFGATTGRRRQVNWMDMQTLERAIRINGVTHVVFNKVDVLREAGQWAVIDKDKVIPFSDEKTMQQFVSDRLKQLNILPDHIFFSESKDRI